MLAVQAFVRAELPFPTYHLARILSNWILTTRTARLLWQVVESLKAFTWVAVPRLPTPYSKYQCPQDIEAYWKEAGEGNERLRASNAASAPGGLQLITYYTPKLLPAYRQASSPDPEAREEYMSPKTFCKWHRMVHPGPLHPTFEEAERLIKHFSTRDRREMKRIARQERDSDVFHEDRVWTPAYRDQWKAWLATKGPDTAIIFSADVV